MSALGERKRIEQKVRDLLNLPPCGCGEGLSCPEIALNMIGHPNEKAALALLRGKVAR